MGLDDRRRAKMAELIHQQSDSALTAEELRRKYGDPDDGDGPPPSPRHKPTLTACHSRPSLGSMGFGVTTTRCWACATALRDPGASFFACGACGALNGEEPKLQRQPFDRTPWRSVCRLAARRGRLAALATTLALVASGFQAARVLLPRLVDQSSPMASASLIHRLLFGYLGVGVAFNFLATMLAGPGDVVEEICPLLAGGATLHADAEAGHATDLSSLKASAGDMPLRGWRRCAETGLSMPPRAHYCRTTKKLILRMEHHCAFLNTCIGHANHHYYLRFLLFLMLAGAYVASAAAYLLRSVSTLAAAGAPMLSAAGAAGRRLADEPDEADGLEAATPPGMGTGNSTSLSQAALHRGELRVLDVGAAAAATQELVVVGALGLCAVAIAGPILLTQVRNLMRGRTHIESLRSPPPTDYDLGVAANCGATFGGRGGCALRLIWHLLPLPCSAVGDGLHFKCRPPPRRV